jgi:CMP-N,N'-diacetyllegionaminic acid synthase
MNSSDIWAIIPARGGSKSIPLKNMKLLGGAPLIDYVIKVAKNSPEITRVICSTDHDLIKKHCLKRGIEVSSRPDHLSGDDISTLDVIIHLLQEIIDRGENLPELIVLFEPTSPFVQKSHVSECLNLMRINKEFTSAQTIVEPPPNHHAYNQRTFEDGCVKFRFPNERLNKINKQQKPKFYVHGNLRVLRSKSVIEFNDLFGLNSIGVCVPKKFALDVDGPEDFEIAEMYLSSRFIPLK